MGEDKVGSPRFHGHGRARCRQLTVSKTKVGREPRVRATTRAPCEMCPEHTQARTDEAGHGQRGPGEPRSRQSSGCCWPYAASSDGPGPCGDARRRVWAFATGRAGLTLEDGGRGSSHFPTCPIGLTAAPCFLVCSGGREGGRQQLEGVTHLAVKQLLP